MAQTHVGSTFDPRSIDASYELHQFIFPYMMQASTQRPNPSVLSTGTLVC